MHAGLDIAASRQKHDWAGIGRADKGVLQVEAAQARHAHIKQQAAWRLSVMFLQETGG
jgi:hypothetical protein